MWPQAVEAPADAQDNTRKPEGSPNPLAGVEGSQDQIHGIVDELIHASASDELAGPAVELHVDGPQVLGGWLDEEPLAVRHAIDLEGCVPVHGGTDAGLSPLLAVAE